MVNRQSPGEPAVGAAAGRARMGRGVPGGGGRARGGEGCAQAGGGVCARGGGGVPGAEGRVLAGGGVSGRSGACWEAPWPARRRARGGFRGGRWRRCRVELSGKWPCPLVSPVELFLHDRTAWIVYSRPLSSKEAFPGWWPGPARPGPPLLGPSSAPRGRSPRGCTSLPRAY